MTAGRAAFGAALAILAGGLAWMLFVALPALYTDRGSATLPPPAAQAPGRKIKARLFYIAESGVKLAGVEEDVPYGEGTVEQARAIINAQIAEAAPPRQSAIPAGTTLRRLFITDRGEAFVDFSGELVTRHTGGSLNELLTINTIVNVLTVNLPTITAVQVLVEGKEIDSLAGHVNLAQPLTKNLTWVE